MPRSFPAWNTSGIGCRDGAGPTAGKTAAYYRVLFPDGTAIEKRVFNGASAPTATAYIYEHEGVWKCAAVSDQPSPRMSSYRTVAADRVR